jgi:hypothetical protein
MLTCGFARIATHYISHIVSYLLSILAALVMLASKILHEVISIPLFSSSYLAELHGLALAIEEAIELTSPFDAVTDLMKGRLTNLTMFHFKTLHCNSMP